MKIIVKKIVKKIFPKYERYAPIIWKNKLNSLLKDKQEHKYLFILSPPFCGSTLLNEIISSSSAVSVNNPYGTREGQTLPTVRKIMFNDANKRWDKTVDFDWDTIKKEWLKYWDIKYPVLLEKSPPNIMRAESLEKNFDPAYFIIFHRNPYAHCESLIRRNGAKAETAADAAIQCLFYQKENISVLKNTVQISYEYLTDNTSAAVQMMKKLVPELEGINFNQKFSALNYMNKKMKIKNLNTDKINKLTYSQLNEINSVFMKNKEILTFFNYELIDNITTTTNNRH